MDETSIQQIFLHATPAERQALQISFLPRADRAVADAAAGTTPQSRSNALRRLRKKMEQLGRMRTI